MSHLLEITNLDVKFALRTGEVTAIDDLNLTLKKGERLGVVGESGAGKSVTGFSIINLIRKPGYIARGSIRFKGEAISSFSEEKMRSIRGNRISMIFQDPMMTLNPVLTIGTQMTEAILAHMDVSPKEAEAIALEKLAMVHIPSPGKRLKQYPHEFSGGMRQRIVIAISLLTNPDLIIADEPTTALDVTIQAEIMDLLIELCESGEMSLILITHDLGVVAETTERIAVMYAGRVIESGPTKEIIHNPAHPYTQGLIKALPESRKPGEALYQIPGMMPTLTDIPPGCAFNPRCPMRADLCTYKRPEAAFANEASGHIALCHLVSGEITP
ncbi:MAG: ABC transporter ATP-binding protein [Desulfobacterales bacterium]|nr:ABC transporter ATP-binding protein [Desulfobacterales bacterium]